MQIQSIDDTYPTPGSTGRWVSVVKVTRWYVGGVGVGVGGGGDTTVCVCVCTRIPPPCMCVCGCIVCTLSVCDWYPFPVPVTAVYCVCCGCALHSHVAAYRPATSCHHHTVLPVPTPSSTLLAWQGNGIEVDCGQ